MILLILIIIIIIIIISTFVCYISLYIGDRFVLQKMKRYRYRQTDRRDSKLEPGAAELFGRRANLLSNPGLEGDGFAPCLCFGNPASVYCKCVTAGPV